MSGRFRTSLCEPGQSLEECGPKTSNTSCRLHYHGDAALKWPWRFYAGRQNYEFGLASLFPGKTFARCAFRRQILYRSPRQWCLLPFDLSCAHGQRKECSLFSDGRRSGGSRFSSVPALPAGMFSGDSCLVRNLEYCFTRFAPDWREGIGSRRDGRSG